MKAYSQDLRQRVLRAIDGGKSQAEVAATFALSTATIKRYLKARRESGHVLPKAIPGRPNVKGAALQAGLLEQLRAHPDATREQHCQHHACPAGSGLDAKKKSIRASEQQEADRIVWRAQAADLPSQDLVFVDETGSHIAMTPLYAYAPRGERAIGKVPRNYGAIMTLIASLSLDGMGPAFILDGAADSTAFEIYVEQILAPSLRPGQIVVLDNLSIHLGPRVMRSCRQSQSVFVLLYPLSPVQSQLNT